MKKKTRKESHKTNEKLILKTKKKTKHGQTNVRKSAQQKRKQTKLFFR